MSKIYLKGRELARINEILETAELMNNELGDPTDLELLEKRLQHIERYIAMIRNDIDYHLEG